MTVFHSPVAVDGRKAPKTAAARVRFEVSAFRAGSSAVQIVCLDLEGVLVPEIWIEFSKRTGIPELQRTTRDEPDYDKLMTYRLHNQSTIKGARPEWHLLKLQHTDVIGEVG